MNIQNTKRHTNQALLDMVYVSFFTALIAVCSQIYIPTAIPFTLQTMAVFITGGILGFKRGALSIIIYLLLGIIGVPVFSEFSSGLGVLLGMTGGYIIGFLFIALIVGLMCDRFGKKVWVLVVSMLIGLAVCYAFGTVWFINVYTRTVEPIDIMGALSLCVFPYLLFDFSKIAVAAVVVNRLDKLIRI